MSSSKSGKSSIVKLVPERSIKLEDFLKNNGIKDSIKHTILVNGKKANLDQTVNKEDEIIVLPVLRGG